MHKTSVLYGGAVAIAFLTLPALSAAKDHRSKRTENFKLKTLNYAKQKN